MSNDQAGNGAGGSRPGRRRTFAAVEGLADMPARYALAGGSGIFFEPSRTRPRGRRRAHPLAHGASPTQAGQAGSAGSHSTAMVSRVLRPWLRPVVVALLAPVLGIVMLRWFEQRQVFQPYAALWAGADELGRPFEDVTLTARDGVRLHGWFFPGTTNSPRAHLAVVFCHGNAGNISHRLESYAVWLEQGVALLAFDYRGYGRSAGRPSEEGTYLDAQAAHAWLRARGFAPPHILACGESLGGAVATELALREPLGGLLLQSTFTSLPDLGAELFPFLPVRTLASIRYATHAKLPRIAVPVGILHGRADSLIRFAHAERNFAALRGPKFLGELAGDHNDFLEADRGQFAAGLVRFLELVRTNPVPPSGVPAAAAPVQDLGFVVGGKSSVRNGEAGRPRLL